MAMQETQIRLYGERRAIALERVLAQPVTALLVYGVTSPLLALLISFRRLETAMEDRI